LHELSEEQLQALVQRCDDVESIDQLTWGHRCHDIGSRMPLAYTWMSEFRSKQIWSKEVLSTYKYMLWMDSDAFCTKEWEQDPVAFMIRNDLVMLYGNFPKGRVKFELPEIHQIIRDVYGKSLCGVTVDKERKTFSNTVVEDWNENIDQNEICEEKKIPMIHGFMHVTNLDFYREEVNMKFYDQYIGDGKFRRSRDDQGAVTIPAAVLAPERTWSMRDNGIVLEVAHNLEIDGRERMNGRSVEVTKDKKFLCGGFRKRWRRLEKEWNLLDQEKHFVARDKVIDANMIKCEGLVKSAE